MSDIDDMIERMTDSQRSEFALACARRVQHLMRDPRSIEALDTRERWLRGEATDEELAAAADAAWAAADAARAAVDAARDAARAAARAAAWDAAWAAAWDAARDTAGAAAWDAERAWQRGELERVLKEGGGA